MQKSRFRTARLFRMVGGGVEKLLAADPISADCRLPVGREQPCREFVSRRELRIRMLGGVQFDDIIAVDQVWIAFDRDDERSFVLET